MKKSRLFFTLLCFFFLFSTHAATVRYVKTSGASDGSSWGNASSDLQAVINSSSSGDEIWVAAGTYKPTRRADATGTITTNDRNNAFVLKSGVKIYGGFAGTETLSSQRNWTTNVTILSGDLGTVGNTSDNAYHVVVSSGSVGTAELNGFTVTGGRSDAWNTITVNSNSIQSAFGGGIICFNSSPTFTNIKILSNYALSNGGGLYNTSSSPVLTGVVVDSNSAGQKGGGIYNTSSSPTITNGIISNNFTVESYGNGGGICNESSSPSIINTLIYKNASGQDGGGIYCNGGSTVITNATIVYNTMVQGYANGGGVSGNATIKNSIIWGNKANGVTNNVSGSQTFSYTLLEAGTLSGTSIISNSSPLFTDFSSDNYHLTRFSPAVNKGSNALNTSLTDLDGNVRIFNSGSGGVIDLGAYEYQSNDANFAPDANGVLYVKKGGNGGGNSWANAIGELSDALYAASGLSSVTQIWVAAGTYYPGYMAGDGATARDKAFILLNNKKIYGGFAGTETSLNNRSIATNVTILSGDLGTIGSSSDNAHHVVISSGSVGTACLDGFTITAGNANVASTYITLNGGAIYRANGGAIYTFGSSPTLSNLTIYSNQASGTGGAVYITDASAPALSNVIVYSNTAANGGAFYFNNATSTLTTANIYSNTATQNGGGIFSNNSTLTLTSVTLNSNTAATNGGGLCTDNWTSLFTMTNVIVKNNVATSGSGGGFYLYRVNNSSTYKNMLVANNQAAIYGGGIYNTINPTFVNMTLASNKAGTNGGGLYSDGSNSNLNNCIIWGNVQGTSTVNNCVGTTYYNYSLLEGGILIANEIISNSNPKFINAASQNYALMGSSPAINLGNNTYISGISTDIAGNTRIQNGTVDLGTYEYRLNEWMGSVSTDWENVANWSANKVLDDYDNLQFNASAANNLVQSKTHYVANITNNSSKQLDINGQQLIVGGNFSFGGSATIKASTAGSTVTLSGSVLQAISSGLFLNNNVYNLIISNPANVTCAGTLKVLNSLSATSGKLDAVTNSPTLNFAGTSAQSLESNVLLNDQAYNLVIDNPAGVTLNADLKLNNNLTINNGKSLIVSTAKKMDVMGTVTNSAGVSGLVIKSSSNAVNGSFIFRNAQNNPVQATVEMYTKAYYDPNGPAGYKYKWQFFGIPVRSLTAQDAFAGSYVRQYVETAISPSTSWVQLGNTSALSSFNGYEITQGNPKTIYYQGALENSDLTRTLTNTVGSNFQGMHILGNPYTAAIDASQLVYTNMQATVYLYNTGSSADWLANNGNTDPGYNQGQYVAVPKFLAGQFGIPGQIPSMQGFMVIANTGGGTFNIPYSSVISKNTDIQRVSGMNKTNTSLLTMTSVQVKGGRFSDKMWLFTSNQCTRSFDNGWDALKMTGVADSPQIFASEADGDYQIDALSNINNTTLGFQAGIESEYTFTFNHQNLSSAYPALYLIDKKENKTIDITTSGTTYTFTQTAYTTTLDRFKIVTNPNVSTAAPELIADSGVKVFVSGNVVHILNTTDANGTLTLYDTSGKTVDSFSFSTGENQFPIHISKGFYVGKAVVNYKTTTTNLLVSGN
jgi:hypothetical protein